MLCFVFYSYCKCIFYDSQIVNTKACAYWLLQSVHSPVSYGAAGQMNTVVRMVWLYMWSLSNAKCTFLIKILFGVVCSCSGLRVLWNPAKWPPQRMQSVEHFTLRLYEVGLPRQTKNAKNANVFATISQQIVTDVQYGLNTKDEECPMYLHESWVNP